MTHKPALRNQLEVEVPEYERENERRIRNVVLDEIEQRMSRDHADPLKAGKGWRLLMQEIIEDMRHAS